MFNVDLFSNKAIWNVLIGMPGAGKSTYINIINGLFGNDLESVMPGETIRGEMKKQTQFGRLIEPIVNAGQLIPDPLAIGLIEPLLRMRNSVFDGYPRNKFQAQHFIKMVDFLSDTYKIEIIPLFYVLDCDRELCRARLLQRNGNGDRFDTSADATDARLYIGENVTMPLVKDIAHTGFAVKILDANKDIKRQDIFDVRTKELADFVCAGIQRGTRRIIR